MELQIYQIAGLITGLIGILLAFVILASPLVILDTEPITVLNLTPVGYIMILINAIALLAIFTISPRRSILGISLIILGIVGNLLLIIAGVLALKYKNKLVKQSQNQNTFRFGR